MCHEFDAMSPERKRETEREIERQREREKAMGVSTHYFFYFLIYFLSVFMFQRSLSQEYVIMPRYKYIWRDEFG